MADADRTAVSLPALIALRECAGRGRVAPVVSRTTQGGQHTTRLFGRGMDYAESRVYQAGDDVRRLDWRLTARSGKLHTKLFQEDREGCLMILLDTHASMRFGTRRRFKSVQAARLAACAAWYAARAGERVGIMAFGQVDALLRPRSGARGALAVCGALAEWDLHGEQQPERAEPLSGALLRTSRLLHGANRVLLISDGFSFDAPAQGLLRELARRGSLRFVLVADAMELKPARPGSYPLESHGHRGLVSLRSSAQQLSLLRMLGAGAVRLRSAATALACPCVEVDGAADACAAATRTLHPARRMTS
jgi:uncharacterized protein (DUF58 family)